MADGVLMIRLSSDTGRSGEADVQDKKGSFGRFAMHCDGYNAIVLLPRRNGLHI